jgi:hypothetical protein
MEVAQAVNVLFQAVDMAVAGGVFKGTRDVAVLDQAKQKLAEFVQVELQEAEAEEPAKGKK